MLNIAEIHINHLKEPKGITGKLSIGWKIESNHKNVVQKGYQIQIAEDSAFTEILFDSGIMESEQSQNILVETEGTGFKSVHYYFLRVRIQDNYGEYSAWSSTRFLTALLNGKMWEADFITAEQGEDKNCSKAVKIRREFKVDKPLREAFLLSTAQGLYQTFLNGARIGKDELTPGWTSYDKRILYQSYDVTEHIVHGWNTWGALAGAGWYKGDITFERIHNFYGEYAAFSGELILRYEDGSEEFVYTDSSWRGEDSAILFSEIYDGEVYDARLEDEEWKKTGFIDKAWRSVDIAKQEKGQISAQSGAAVRVQELLKVRKSLKTPKGETVLDFGQNISGWVHFQVSGKPGDIVELICFETLDGEGNVYTDNLRTAKQRIQYICSGKKKEEYHPHFTFMGFRYVWVKQYPVEIKPDDFKAFVLYSDMKEIGTFHCSHSLLNRLQSNIMWGLKGNSVDIPSDCPQRDERLGWTGDAQVFCNTACYLMDMYEFYRKWLCDIAADQREDGAVANVVPEVISRFDVEHAYGASGWGDAAVVLPWILYQETGDKIIIEEMYESMKNWIDYVMKYREAEDYSYAFQYGDWLALDADEGSYHGRTPVELTCAAYFSYASGLFAQMADAVGRRTDAVKYKEIHDKSAALFRKKYFLPDGRMSVQTQTAYVLALSFGLVPEQCREQTVNGLIELLKQKKMHLSTGFLGTPYLMHALSENGCVEEAYEILLKEDFPSWLYQVRQGATTVWEHWDGVKTDGSMWSADMNSFNHYAYGAVGKWLYEVCAGLKWNEKNPGYKHFYVEPHPGGNLQYAETTHVSEYGLIYVYWEREEFRITLDIKVPHNTTATVILSQADKILISGGLEFTKRGDIFITDVGSGDYEIQYQMNQSK